LKNTGREISHPLNEIAVKGIRYDKERRYLIPSMKQQ
jgi:hypothetical protein